jgi:DNA-binding transcriptional MerR regulator
MFFQEETSNQKIAQLLKRQEELSDQLKALFNNIGFTPEELSAYLSNPENFTSEDWETIQTTQREMDERLERLLNNVANPERAGRGMRLRRQRARGIPC